MHTIILNPLMENKSFKSIILEKKKCKNPDDYDKQNVIAIIYRELIKTDYNSPFVLDKPLGKKSKNQRGSFASQPSWSMKVGLEYNSCCPVDGFPTHGTRFDLLDPGPLQLTSTYVKFSLEIRKSRKIMIRC